jgi:hypothetical protein
MRLNKAQFQQTEAALLHAFDRDALRMMLRRQLDEDLDVVAGDDELATVVFNLVTWAERNSRVNELIAGALAENPNNAGLKTLAADYRRWASAQQQEPPRAPPHGQPSSRRSTQGWLFSMLGVVAVAVIVVLMIANGGIPWPSSATPPPVSEPTDAPKPEPTDTPLPEPVGQRPVVVSQTHSPRTPTTADILTIQGAANDIDGNLANLRIVFDGVDIALCNDPASFCEGTVDLSGQPSGAHTYQVIACDYDGLCSNNPAVSVRVEPAPLRIYAAEFGGCF